METVLLTWRLSSEAAQHMFLHHIDFGLTVLSLPCLSAPHFQGVGRARVKGIKLNEQLTRREPWVQERILPAWSSHRHEGEGQSLSVPMQFEDCLIKEAPPSNEHCQMQGPCPALQAAWATPPHPALVRRSRGLPHCIPAEGELFFLLPYL